MESKKKWLNPAGFKTTAQHRVERYSDLYYVQADPSEPAATFQFRTDDKDTYLHGPFRVN